MKILVSCCPSPLYQPYSVLFFFFFLICWRLITLQYCSGFCHTLTRISHGFTCVPHPDPPSHLPLRLISLGLPSASGPSTCLMHPTWLFCPLKVTLKNFGGFWESIDLPVEEVTWNLFNASYATYFMPCMVCVFFILLAAYVLCWWYCFTNK